MGMCAPSGGINPPVTGNRLEPNGQPPNSLTRLFDRFGRLIRERWYDANGNALWDRDHTDHGNPANHPQVPHDHGWLNGIRERPWRMPSGAC